MSGGLAELRQLLGADRVRDDAKSRAELAQDMTECAPGKVDAVLLVASAEEVAAVVKIAAAQGIPVPLTPRVAGTNLGGLAIPARGGWVLDLTRMNRIVELHAKDQLAVIEPGVTFGQLKDALDQDGSELTLGFPLSPPETSVMANCLLDGLGNLSLRHGAMGEWIAGLEAVRGDGSFLRTGVMALGVPVPFGRAPLPDLTGAFVSWQGTTGIVTKLAVELWPTPRFRERSFAFAWQHQTVVRLLTELPRLDLLDDLAALSWPTGKMLLGVERPGPRDPAEPEFFVYMDVGSQSEPMFSAKRRELRRALKDLGSGGGLEGPIDVPSLVRLEPRLGKFAQFPTRLDFLLDNPGGGLTWVGTYGPLSRFEAAMEDGLALCERFGVPPTVVARPMKGGHFSVLRFISTFDRRDQAQVNRTAELNQALCDALINHGFVMYKTPGWAVARYAPRLDPGFSRLRREIKSLLDPSGLMNPGRWEA